MPSSPFYGKCGRTTLGMACHHFLWAAQTVEQRWARHAIIALGRQTLSNDVGRGMPSPPLDSTTWSNDVGHDIPLTPLDNTHGKMTLGLACHHRLWAARTFEQLRARHAIIALEWQTPANDVGRGMPSSHSDSVHGRTTSWAVPLCEPWFSSNNLCSD